MIVLKSCKTTHFRYQVPSILIQRNSRKRSLWVTRVYLMTDVNVTCAHVTPANEPFTEPHCFFISAAVWRVLNSFYSAINQVSDGSPTDAIISPWERWEPQSVWPCRSRRLQGAKSTHTHTQTSEDHHTRFSTSCKHHVNITSWWVTHRCW